jgi:ribosomal protein S18 acetylase RimI-like enzyme
MPDVLALREARETDARRVADLIRRSFERQAELLEIDQREFPNYVAFETEDGVLRRMRGGGRVTLARAGEVLVGTVTVRVSPDDPARGELLRLAVDPSYRARGYGEALMQRAEARLFLSFGVVRSTRPSRPADGGTSWLAAARNRRTHHKSR